MIKMRLKGNPSELKELFKALGESKVDSLTDEEFNAWARNKQMEQVDKNLAEKGKEWFNYSMYPPKESPDPEKEEDTPYEASCLEKVDPEMEAKHDDRAHEALSEAEGGFFD